jgi:hypothetical protein
VGRIYIAVPCQVVAISDGQDQFIVESGKRALNVVAEGTKRLLCGDNSIAAAVRQTAKLG